MGEGDEGRGPSAIDTLRALPLRTAATLLARRREVMQAPYAHARATSQLGRGLARLRHKLSRDRLRSLEAALGDLAQLDLTAAGELSLRLGEAADQDEELLSAGGEISRLVCAVARTDRTSAQALARKLPAALLEVAGPGFSVARKTALRTVRSLAGQRTGLAQESVEQLPTLVSELSPAALDRFVAESIALLEPGSHSRSLSFLSREARGGRERFEQLRGGLALRQVTRTLQLYAEAHCGHAVRLRSLDQLPPAVRPPAGASSISDGRTIYLRDRLARYPDDEANFDLYKAICAHEVGRIEFGSFEPDAASLGLPAELSGVAALRAWFDRFPDPELAGQLFLLLEDARVDARLRDHYPGLSRLFDRLAPDMLAERTAPSELSGQAQVLEQLARLICFGREAAGAVPEELLRVESLLSALRQPDARVEDSLRQTGQALRLIREAMGQPTADLPPEDDVEPGGAPHPTVDPGDGEGDPGEPEGDSGEGEEPAQNGEGQPAQPDEAGGGDATQDTGASSDPLNTPGMAWHGGLSDSLEDAFEEALAERMEELERSLHERGAQTGRDELEEALRRDPDASDEEIIRTLLDREREQRLRDLSRRRQGDGAAPEEIAVHRYPEWDHWISDYRPGWVSVRERSMQAADPEFAAEVLSRHGGLVGQLRRQFQLLRAVDGGRRRGEPEGDEIDVDAAVRSLIERRAGYFDDRVYVQNRHPQRDVAVAFLVDLSASTKEIIDVTGRSVIDVEKEALILMAEALEALGDRYAIYGFSGRARFRATFDIYKRFGERWDARARARVGAMHHQRENRDGAAIRHACARLAEVPARTRLLILLSDGKPLDCGCEQYHDEYAQEDTRAALREARTRQIHPFCITVDRTGHEYLERMYGGLSYTVIDRVGQLPARLPAIYRRLTS